MKLADNPPQQQHMKSGKKKKKDKYLPKGFHSEFSTFFCRGLHDLAVLTRIQPEPIV